MDIDSGGASASVVFADRDRSLVRTTHPDRGIGQMTAGRIFAASKLQQGRKRKGQ